MATVTEVSLFRGITRRRVLGREAHRTEGG